MESDIVVYLIPFVVTVALIIAGLMVLTSNNEKYRVQVLLAAISYVVFYTGGEVIDRLDSLIRLTSFVLRNVEQIPK